MTKIEPSEYDTYALTKWDGQPVVHPTPNYTRILPPPAWSGFGLSGYKAAIQSAAKYEGGGESDLHKALKKYIALNPQIVGLPSSTPGVQEHLLPSGDSVDVYFENSLTRTAVEVKSRISPETDIVRGLFQCVKYRAVLAAIARVESCDLAVDALLVLEMNFPSHLRELAATLDVRVVENVRVAEQNGNN